MTTEREGFYVNFGHALRRLRESHGLTQHALAKRIGLTRTSVVNIERGRQRILLHQVEIFARAFRMSSGRFLAHFWK